MAVLTTLSEQLPNDHGEPLSKKEVLTLCQVRWNEVNEFDDIDDGTLDALRDERLIRWLTSNFDDAKEVMTEVTTPDGGVDPRVFTNGDPVFDPKRRRERETIELLSDDRYDDARDALFSAMDEFAKGHVVAAENVAQWVAESFEELREELDVNDDRDRDDDERSLASLTAEHLGALIAAADELSKAAAAARDGHDSVAKASYDEAQEWIHDAAEDTDEMRGRLRP